MIHYTIDPIIIQPRKIEDLICLPKVITVNEFTEKSALDFRDNFAKAINTGQQIIPIVIDSYGGTVYSLLSMVATIKSSTIPVATIVTGKAMSCGSVLLTCGTEGLRFIDPCATVMIHEASNCLWGKIEEIKADAKETERLNNLIIRMMATNIGKPENYFFELIDQHKHADWYLDAAEVKKHNLANHIRIPTFKVKVSANVSFE